VMISTWSFKSSTAYVELAATGAGTVQLRPNGSGNGTGEAVIYSSGDMTVTGNISTLGANTNVVAAGGFVTGTGGISSTAPSGYMIIGAGNATGYIQFRPQGMANLTKQMSLDYSGNLTVDGNVITVAPTADLHAATKKYVDDKPAGGVTVSDTAPAHSQGQLWWNSANGNLYISYNDGDSTAWIQVNTVSV
jgi:hypothetical protein